MKTPKGKTVNPWRLEECKPHIVSLQTVNPIFQDIFCIEVALWGILFIIAKFIRCAGLDY